MVRGGWAGHAPVESTDLFVPYLRDEGFAVTVEHDLDAYADGDLMARTDLVLQSWSMGELSADQLRGLREAVAAGTGLAGWHGGIVATFHNQPGYTQLTGGQFVAHPGGIVEHTIEVPGDQADHPVVTGIGRISLRSEQYWVVTDPLIDVLATTTIARQPGDPWAGPITSPAVWTRTWGAGRVFVCTPGHQPADLEVPEVRTIVERGLLWAARSVQAVVT